tara:strand:+ start:243 stop:374 length:132 start_codon:yes stop_codon:yes gene_type:complete
MINYKDEIIDWLVLGGYSLSDVAEEFEIEVEEVRFIYNEYIQD